MEKLKIVNPEMVKYRKRFIQWKDKEDGYLLEQLIECGIYIDGFVSDDFAGETWCNKNFFGERSVQDMSDACVLVRNLKDDYGTERRLRPFIVNPEAEDHEIMIYGSGKWGMEAFKYLKTQPVRVLGFIDSNLDKQGGMFDGYKIYPPEIVKEMDKSVAIVVAALRGSQEMEDTVKKYADVRTCQFVLWEEPMCCGDTIFMDRFNYLCKAICKRRIYLYGSDEKMKKYAEFFRLYDLAVKGILTETYEDGG